MVMGKKIEANEVLNSPVFIVGSPRSGTTWLQKLFLEHPNVIGGQESEFFFNFGCLFSAIKEPDPTISRPVGMNIYWHSRKEEFEELIRHIWRETFKPLLLQKEYPTLLLEKTPIHALQIDRIKSIFPTAKFIHIIRDSRSTCASLISAANGWGKHWAPSSPKDAAVLWWRSVHYGRKLGLALNSDYIEVHYEDLLRNSAYELGRLYNFCSLSYSEEQLKNIIKKQSISTQKNSLGEGLKDVSGKTLKEPAGFFGKAQKDSWRKDLNLYQKLIIWKYTRKLMRECGYDWNGRIYKNGY
ncbi:sulfotransferase [Methylophaga thalassica]|uniref:sulfotransferase family protein n=1 Tax=Methylophaga thalassica TaxID=40223 RepID=UPI002E7B8454|nr:sulfotransferase [Methylophaga thalassica]WVI84746.1 sulfotransferase [Methylophaga thalassica]